MRRSFNVLSSGVFTALAALTLSLVCTTGETLPTPVAWGFNGGGELGNNSTSDSHVPVAVDTTGVLAGKAVIAVAGGRFHDLALTSDGQVFAWGANSNGQLGNNSTTESLVPVAVEMTGVLAGKTVIAIAGGLSHSLALTSEGQVFAWGVNSNGQLGNNSTTDSHVPVAVDMTGVLAGKTVIAIACAQQHSLALTSDGQVFAWGYNGNGQMGNNSTDESHLPVAVDMTGALAGKTVAAIACAQQHNLALTSDGQVFAWGRNNMGQLGNNSTTDGLVPVAVDMTGVLAGKTVAAISGGLQHSLALTSDGQVFAWGYNGQGELGNNSTTVSHVPVAVDMTGVLSGKTVIAIVGVRFHNLALTSDGQVFAWGSDIVGELGNNSTTDSHVPVAVDTTGVLSGRYVGALGSCPLADYSLAIAALPYVTSVAGPLAGTYGVGQTLDFTLSYNEAVTVDATGGIPSIRLAVGSAVRSAIYQGGSGTKDIVFRYTIAPGEVDDDGVNLIAPVLLNGGTMKDDLGNGMALTFNPIDTTGVLVETTPPSITISAPSTNITSSASVSYTVTYADANFASSTLAVGDITLNKTGSADGTVGVTGSGTSYIVTISGIRGAGTLGISIASGTATDTVGNLAPASGASGTFAVRNTSVVAWGFNGNGELGNNSTTESHVPVGVDMTGVLAGKTVIAVALGQRHSLALTSDGQIFAWGRNNQGQLGNNSITDSHVPVAVDMTGVLAGKTVIAIEGGQLHSLALTSDGQIFAWGRNNEGQLGNNSATDSHVPVAVDLTGVLAGKTVVAIAGGALHNLALTLDGQVFAWGNNANGQLGNNSTTDSPIPVGVDMTGVLAGKTVAAIAGGRVHTLVSTSDGQVFAWGRNSSGQLGNNSTTDSHVPVTVDMTGVLAGKTVAAIAAGTSHSLALSSDGKVFAWGINDLGDLGNNSVTASHVPVAVDMTGVLAGKTAVTIASGESHGLALTSDGKVFAWGFNAQGELGNNSTTTARAPVAVDTTGVLNGSDVGRVGSGSASDFNLAIAALPYVVSVAGPAAGTYGAGHTLDFTLSYNQAVTVDTMGGIPSIRLAVGSALRSATYQGGSGSTDITFSYTIAAGDADDDGVNLIAPILLNGGTMKDDLGNGVALTFNPIDTTGVLVEAVPPTVSIGAPSASTTRSGPVSYTVTYADANFASSSLAAGNIKLNNTGSANGTVGVSGSGTSYTVTISGITGAGTLGITIQSGTATDTLGNLAPASAPSATFGVSNTTVVGWGMNNSGTFGNNSTDSSRVPVPFVDLNGVLTGKTIIALAPGSNHVLALSADGQVFGWGYDGEGELGDNSFFNSLVPVAADMSGALAGKTVIAIAAGQYHSLALTSDGLVFAWGRNSNGVLGNGSTDDSRVPVAVDITGVLAGKNVVAIAAGAHHSLALTSEGQVVAWGLNDDGELGINSTTESHVPVLVDASGALAGKTMVGIAAGASTSLALSADGQAFAWGFGTDGELGNNAMTNSLVPVAVDASGVLAGKHLVSLAGGLFFSMALSADGEVFAWGLGAEGQLGNNSTDSSSVPVAVDMSGVLSGKTVIGISAGAYTGYALTSDGQIYDWGYDFEGELGDGNSDNVAAPTTPDYTGALNGTLVGAVTSSGNAIYSLALQALPFITGVTGPDPGTYKEGDNLDFTITYNQTVKVDTTGGTPSIPLNIGSALRRAVYRPGVPSGTLSFRYTVVADDNDINGITLISPILLNGGTIEDDLGNGAALNFNPIDTTAVLVVNDSTLPNIAIGSPSAATTGTTPVTYDIIYSDAHFASSSLGTGDITLNKTGTANGTIGVSGSGTSYVVTISGITGNGTLGISIAAGTASDAAGNLAPAAGPSTTFVVANPPALDLNGADMGIDVSLNYAENDPATLIAPFATLTDADSAILNGGNLTIAYSTGGGAEDQILIRNQGTSAGQIGISSGTISFAGTTIGTVPTSGAGSGQNGASLIVSFTTADATLAAVQALIQNLEYQNSSDSPALSRTLSMTVDDGTGGVSNPAVATITVAPGADTPSVTSATTTENIQTTSGLVISRNAADGAEVTHFKITGIIGGTLFLNNGTTPISEGDFITFAQGNAGLKFTPSTDLYGPVTTFGFNVQASVSASDAGLGGGTAAGSITVNIVNKVPSFTKGANEIVKTNAGPQTVSGWATGISPGTGEGTQKVDFIVSNDNPSLFAAQPAIASDGTLTYQPGLDASGISVVTVQIHDNGGTSNGGVDTSGSQTFTIELMVLPMGRGDHVIADRGPYVSTGKVLLIDNAGDQSIISTALKDPYGVALDKNGNILVADYETTSIFGTGGLYRFNRYNLSRVTVSSGGNFVTPFGVALEADGNILVADLDAFSEVGAIFRVNPSTGAQSTLATGGNFYWLRGIAVNTNTGAIYVSDLRSATPGSEAIIEINPTTGAQTVLSTGGNFSHPDGMAIDPSTGDVIVAEAANKMLIRVDKTTGLQTIVSDDPQFIEPTHVTVDLDTGDFYVTDAIIGADVGERRMYRVDKTTGVATIISVDGFFDEPRGITTIP